MGFRRQLLPFHATPQDYVVFVGRISPEKRVDRAIEIARRAGVTLLIAAKIDRADRDYFAATVEPMLNDPGVQFVGEVDEAEKVRLIGQARALLFPIDWPEPFGMVVIEALSCGTPVIAWNHGSIPELLEHGVTGFVVDSIEAAAEAVDRARTLDRAACRKAFEARFEAGRMAREYVTIYEKVIERGGRRLEAMSA